MSKMTPFASRVYAIVKQNPRGEALAYEQVAIAAGRPGACRAVETILSKNFDPAIPCHRVIRSDGKTGGYNRGEARKAERLREEGFSG